MRETITSGNSVKVLDFIYDNQGKPFALKYSTNGGSSFTTYYYVLNLQGDVVKLVNASGTAVATYTYNAWGEVLTATGSMASINPYDESGSPFALRHSTNGSSFTTYYYVLNLQGDVVKLVNAGGTAYATYTYNAWGEVLTSTGTMASVNPLRYRGYYYDTETGFYYLQSRYYDPMMHRFINADSYASTDSTDAIACNMFAYCGNNPVMEIDPTGDWSWGGFLAGLATVAVGVVAVVATVATAGAAAPLASAAVVGVGTLASSAIITTGATVAYAAATDSTAVIEAGYNIGHSRAGLSLVMDFNGGDNDTYELYRRSGITTSSGVGAAYSTGLVEDYHSQGDYSGSFVSVSGSVKGYGLDYCQSPFEKPGEGARATTVSFSIGTSSAASISGAYDYYTPICFWR